MDRYGRFIVKHRILVVAVFGFLLIPSLFGMAFTRKNYDILSYMPGDLNSRQGEEILQEKFNVRHRFGYDQEHGTPRNPGDQVGY